MTIINRLYVLYTKSATAVVTALLLGAFVRYLLPQSVTTRELAATAASLASGLLIFMNDLSASAMDQVPMAASSSLQLFLYILALFLVNGGMIYYISRLTSTSGQNTFPRPSEVCCVFAAALP
jgi:hypothetical protein